ncbi:HNH endonuclease [Roseateles chitinivorans]|uniref:HNH endonuclease n=1 Tax=Roseateles chitinivorans TaxID=2917965 RepID=UPI003D669704
MNREQQAFAYQIAQEVFEGRISKMEGAKQIGDRSMIEETSAGFLVAGYVHMRNGQLYNRGLNRSDTEYLIDRIAEAEGLKGLALALEALRLHIAYRKGLGHSQRANEEILERQTRRLRAMENWPGSTVVDMSALNLQFSDRVAQSLLDSKEERRKRLLAAEQRPRRVIRLIEVFERNPDVVAEVLHRAKGHCESCGADAPFKRRRDGSPYLEVHHKRPLSEGGVDTVKNALALCPNCHRRMHFGTARIE